MKNFKPIIAHMLLLSLVTACNQQKVDKDEFAHEENMKDELRESLFICLNTEEIIYQVDNDNNVLIKNKTQPPWLIYPKAITIMLTLFL